MTDLIDDGFDVRVMANDGRITTYLSVTLLYLNAVIIPFNKKILNVSPAKSPRSAILADCLEHPHSVTNG